MTITGMLKTITGGSKIRAQTALQQSSIGTQMTFQHTAKNSHDVYSQPSDYENNDMRKLKRSWRSRSRDRRKNRSWLRSNRLTHWASSDLSVKQIEHARTSKYNPPWNSRNENNCPKTPRSIAAYKNTWTWYWTRSINCNCTSMSAGQGWKDLTSTFPG